jgi:hypothetical protein
MGEKNPKSGSENQEATPKSLPPSVSMEEYMKMKEQFKQTTGMTVEEFFELQRKIEEQKKQQLKLELEKINEEIQRLMQKKIEIQNELGISKTARTRNTANTEGIAFRYNGQIMPANAIAKALGLDAYYSNAVNWKEKFKSVLIYGNEGGKNPQVAEKIKKYVEVVYL